MIGRPITNRLCLHSGIRFAAVIAALMIASTSAVGQRVFFGDPEPLDTSIPIPYFITNGRGIPGWEPSDGELARRAIDAWSRESGDRLRFVEVADESVALVRLRWVSTEEGLFGETERTRVNGRTGAFVYVMPDVSQLGQPLASRAGNDKLLRDTIVYLTCVHELGHAIGLGHTAQFEDIMYSFAYGGDLTEYFMRYRRQLESRADIPIYSGLSPADREALRSLYADE